MDSPEVSTDESENLLPLLKEEDLPNQSITFTLIFVTLIFFLSSLQFGYGIGELNSAQYFMVAYSDNYNHTESIENESNKTCHHMLDWFKDCLVFPQKYEDSLIDPWVWINSIFSVGGMIGALSGGPLSDLTSRKMMLFMMSFVFVLGYCFQTAFSHFVPIMIGRFIQGVAAGVCSGVVPMYLMEVTPTKYSGLFGLVPQVGVTFGIFLAQTISIFTTKTQWWRFLLGGCVLFCLVQICVIPFLPYSPKFLLKRKKEDKAKKHLRKFRKSNDVEKEFESMKKGMNVNKNVEGVGMTRFQVIYNLVIGVGLQLVQQFSGVNAIIFYSTSVFKETKVPISPDIITAIISFINFVAVFPGAFLIDKWGRKPLLIMGVSVQLVSTVSVTITMTVSAYISNSAVQTVLGVLSILAIIVYLLFFELGAGPIPWMIVGELFTTKYRPFAYAVCTFVNWGSMFMVGLFFPYIRKSIHTYSFIPFVGVMMQVFFYKANIFSSRLSLFFLIFLVKETKGRDLEKSLRKNSDMVVNSDEIENITSVEEEETVDVKTI